MDPIQLGEIARYHQADLRRHAEEARLAHQASLASGKRRRFRLRLRRKRASLRPVLR